MKNAASISLFILAATAMTFQLRAGEVTGDKGHGGDPLGLEFKNAAATAIGAVKANHAVFSKLDGANLLKILHQSRVLVSDQRLNVKTKNDGDQDSAAINYHSRSGDVIVINRSRWNAIESADVKQALALHEVLGLSGVEDTGNYSQSQLYLEMLGHKNASSLLAKAQHSIGDQKGVIRLLKGQALSCAPTDKSGKFSPDYKGDMGYFKVIAKNNEVEITDNGGMGFGFASGEVQGIDISGTVLNLTVGDDGFQVLRIDFADIGNDADYGKNCAPAMVMDAPESMVTSGFSVACCLGN